MGGGSVVPGGSVGVGVGGAGVGVAGTGVGGGGVVGVPAGSCSTCPTCKQLEQTLFSASNCSDQADCCAAGTPSFSAISPA